MTAADRPSVTDNARAAREAGYAAVWDSDLLTDDAEFNALIWRCVETALRAAGRAETTTELYPCLPSLGEPCGNCHRCTDPAETTTADAQTGTFEAILAAHRDEYDSDCGMYFGCSCGWDNDDIGSNEGYVEHVAGLLATARTRPTETEWGVRSPSAGVTPWGPREVSARRHADGSGHALVRREVTPWTEANQ